MPDLAPIKGLIELQDNFTGQIGLAEAALDQFTKNNQESLRAVAGAAGIVTAAIGAIAVATVELGKRGAEVNDVRSALSNLAGGAEQANAAIAGLRKGTLGTIDDFTLAKEAAHLLGAGVKLSAEDFNTLGAAAQTLADRGLGSTEEQLKLVSDALATGRTRALSMALGVIDAGDAEENYAKKLGVTKDQLSEAGKAEAHRVQVMGMLSETVKKAGENEQDFGDKFAAAGVQVQNWIDDLGAAIASSDVFMKGLNAVQEVFRNTFGDDQSKNIATVVSYIESGAIKVLDFAQAAISAARVVEGAFNAVKTVILGVETVIVGLAQGLAEALAVIATAAEKVHLISPEAAEEVRTSRAELRGMTADLVDQTKEAAKGVFGQTEFSKTLDKVSAGIKTVRDSMASAKPATEAQTKATEEQSEAAKRQATTQQQSNAAMVDAKKVQDALTKSTKELATMQAEYTALVTRNSGTSRDAQIADIEAVFRKQVETLDKTDPLYAQKYETIRKIAKEKQDQIGSGWDQVRDKSIEGLQQQADAALKTYNDMISSGLHFRREVLDDQLKKYHELQDAANGWGDTAKKNIEETAQAVKVLDSAWVTDASIAEATLNKTTVMVRTLHGELISLQEAQNRRTTGGSYDVTSANFDTALQSYITHGGFTSGVFTSIYRDPKELAQAGYSFEEIIKYAFNKDYQGKLPPPQGPKIPGFAEGGLVMVGERGPEAVRLPFGSQVYPNGTMPGGPNITLNFQVNGTGVQVANEVERILMNKLKTIRQFPAA